jgi:hypothetical protein
MEIVGTGGLVNSRTRSGGAILSGRGHLLSEGLGRLAFLLR